MATILLSAAGAALGSGFGGTVLGLSGAVIGRAVGATVGRAIDQRLLGGGAEPVETGRVERFRVAGASEGTAIGRIWGRVRLPGQVIWTSKFSETAATSGGGKGNAQPSTTSFSYTVSLALALCEGEARCLGRIWADGIEQSPATLNLRFYPGSETQLPDPKIEAVDGAGMAPGFRGLAYVVIEDLDLSRFGNRVPQFNFEVVRPAQGDQAAPYLDMASTLRAVALLPGTGEYALATTPVYFTDAPGVVRNVNTNTLSGLTDLELSINQLGGELPQVAAVSIVVSWFGSDLRCANCAVQPKVEQSAKDATGMAWRVSGQIRATAAVVPTLSGGPVYGGSPADASVVEAIAALKEAGKAVMFYPFILMDQLADNILPNPYDPAGVQPALPWRGRITTSLAPGVAGSPDTTGAAATEVAAFFGTAQPANFSVTGTTVTYTGPTDWGYRRFILHYAHLCAAAGGVAAFVIGSELRGLTQIRGAAHSFPTVAALCTLAAEVRVILGQQTKITYAADWSEYFGHQTSDNLYFHLDPLWAHPAIDCIGIDNYMPIADWRDGQDHADAGFGSIYNLEYLQANIAGGEGFDWYYDSPEGVEAQLRKNIQDGAYGEDWVYRNKDLKSWWQLPHHQRLGGIRQVDPTAWVPQSKPFWFTEFGCAAIDKGANQPNLFMDAKSSESALPRASTGHRDDLMQAQYLRATLGFWAQAANNPTSTLYAGRMVDLDRCFAWAWDARPYPVFPAQSDVWSDGENYAHGHWLNGRASNQLLSAVVAEICDSCGLGDVDLTRTHGIVRGYGISSLGSGRSDLQPLTLAHAVDGFERNGVLEFRGRSTWDAQTVLAQEMALNPNLDGAIDHTRQSAAEAIGRLRLGYVQADGDFAARSVETALPDERVDVTSSNEVPLMLTASEATDIAERWLSEARAARDNLRLALPPSRLDLGVGDVIALSDQSYRIDAAETAEAQLITATRIHPGLYTPGAEIDDPAILASVATPSPVYPVFLDLPLLTGDEVPHAPHLAVVCSPWQGSTALWSAATDAGYALSDLVERGGTFGVTQTELASEPAGIWARGGALRVKLSAGTLSSAQDAAVLSGANTAFIGDGTPGNWEVFQFCDAVLVAPQTYDLSRRLRGQAGSNAIMPASWPSGSQVVLMGSAVRQISLASSARCLLRHYRTGLASLGYADPRVVHQELAFAGIGLRPYSVAHLSVSAPLGSAISLGWIRRTRIDGDPWAEGEVPLGEDRERYVVRVRQGATVLRQVEVTTPGWIYSLPDQTTDGVAAGAVIEVAQISDRFGPGPYSTFAL